MTYRMSRSWRLYSCRRFTCTSNREPGETVRPNSRSICRIQCCHRVEKARGQTAQSTIAQAGVAFVVPKRLPIQSDGGHGGSTVILQSQVDDVVAEQPADQEFQREGIDSLDVVLVMGLLRSD